MYIIPKLPLRILLPLAGALLLGGCQYIMPAPPGLPPPPELSFTRYQPIYLDVANLDIVEEYKSPLREPYVEHLLPISPAEGMRSWAKDRLRAAGAEKSLQIIIKDASVVSSELPPPEGATPAVFSDNPNRRYDAKIDVDLRVYGTGAMSEAHINVIATQTITLNERANVEERKRAFQIMMYDLMELANAELEKQIFKHFVRYIMYAQTP